MFVNLDQLAALPAWLQSAALGAGCLATLAVSLATIVKSLQSPRMMSVYRAIPPVVRKLGELLERQTKDPIRYPRIERLLQYGTIVQSYTMSLMLIALFTAFSVLYALSAEKLAPWKHLVVIAHIFACAYMAAVFKGQGGREVVRLRKQKRHSA